MVRKLVLILFCASIGLNAAGSDRRLLTLSESASWMAEQEKITLSVAETKPSNAEYRLERLTVQYDDPATTPGDEGQLSVQLLGQNGESVSCVYNATSAPTATFLINALNKADLSSAYNNNATTGSLKQRIYHRLVIMGESTLRCGKTLTGSLAGAVP